MALRTESIKALRAKRARLAEEARGILTAADGDTLDAADQERFDAAHTEIEALRSRIEAEERQLDLDAELAEPTEVRTRNADGETETREVTADEKEARAKRYSQAFSRHLRGAATAEDHAFLAEKRALSVGTDSAGGYTVPEDFYRQIQESMLAFGGMRQVATVIRSDNGAPLPIPTSDDTSNKGAILAENAQISEQDVAFGEVRLGAYKYTSKLVRVSQELLQDSAFDLESWLAGTLGTRVARITNEHFTTGTGSGQPSGIVTDASSGVTAAAANAITYGELVDLQHSVDPAYRRNGARWMFNDSTLKSVKKLVDGDSRPLWSPGVAVREPDTILGHQYVINQDVATMAASAKAVLFGDLSKYMIRDVLGFSLVIFREKYMDYFQVGFAGFSRHDGALIDAGTDPVKFITMAAA